MLNRWARYWPIIDFIEAMNPKTILEVGSGSYGLAEFSSRRVIGCDLEFSTLPLSNMLAVSASCVNLPFPSGAFELVISLDMLEHIPEKDRVQTILELLRVSSKHVIIGSPCGNIAKGLDYKLFKYYKKQKRNIPAWLIEHSKSQFPEEKDIGNLLDKLGVQYNIRNNENVITHFLIMRGEMIHWSDRIFRISVRYSKLSRLILLCANFGKPYRKIFYISKPNNEHKA